MRVAHEPHARANALYPHHPRRVTQRKMTTTPTQKRQKTTTITKAAQTVLAGNSWSWPRDTPVGHHVVGESHRVKGLHLTDHFIAVRAVRVD